MKKISLDGLGLEGYRPATVHKKKPKKLAPVKANHYLPTDEDAAKVEALASIGTPEKDIAVYLGIAEATLKRHYPDLLNKSLTDKNLAMARTLYQTGMDGDVKAMMFWLKTRAGWQEKTQVEITTNISITAALEQAQQRVVDWIEGHGEEVDE